MKYYVYYVNNSTPKLKKFKTKKQLNNFVKTFRVSINDGYWIDFIFKGKIKYIDPSLKGISK